MIYTKELIVSPSDFLQANPSILSGMESTDFRVISGPDIDALVTTSLSGCEPNQSVKNVATLLGNLYQTGSLSAIEIGEQKFNVNWYPSPVAANELAESLGLRPGEDVLRFCHAAPGFDRIPAQQYVEYVSRGEYPQSTGKGLFSHDRDQAHAIGVLLMPTFMTQAVRRGSQDVLDNPRPPQTKKKKKYTRVGSMTDAIDSVTSYVSIFGRLELEDLGTERAEEQIKKHPYGKQNSQLVRPGFWSQKRVEQEDLRKRKVRLPELVLEHLIELKSVIEKLKVTRG